VKRCTVEDNDKVVTILSDPMVYWWVSDDMSPPPDKIDYTAFLSNESVYVLMPRDGIVIIFIPQNGVMWEVHSAALPEYRGKEMHLAGRESILWMFTNTPCRKIETHVPTFNRAAYGLSVRCKMTKEGISRQSFLRDGKLYDQAVFGITKEEALCQP